MLIKTLVLNHITFVYNDIIFQTVLPKHRKILQPCAGIGLLLNHSLSMGWHNHIIDRGGGNQP